MSKRSSQYRRLTCLALMLCCSACSRRPTKHELASTSGTPSAKPSPTAAATAGSTPLLAAKPALPPAPPNMAPQFVACGQREFYRITQRTLDVFEVADQLPPPQIRGSKVARQTNEVKVADPLNVITLPKKAALVIAESAVLRYQLGEAEARRYAPIPVRGPLVASLQPGRVDAVRVRTLGDAKLEDYVLVPLPRGDAGAAAESAKAVPREAPLPDFDARLFTLLADGTPWYSTPKGLVRHGRESRLGPSPEPAGPATLLFADSSPNRYWAADASGKLGLWELEQGTSPLATASVPGVVIDTAWEGDKVAVLSMALIGDAYQPTVAIFTNGKEQARLSLGPNIASLGQPKLDLCLIAGRPWVVVGGKHWLQLFDWSSRRLLAEW